MRRSRVISQWVFGLLFVVLFLNTRYLGEDVIPYPVNAFFQIDPLAGLAAMGAGRRVLGFFWPLLLMLPLTILFGRFFCGWICPLGGLLDLFGRRSAVRAPRPAGRLYPAKDIMLLVILLASVLAMNLSGLLDPLSLLIRGLAMGVVHPLERTVHALFDGAWRVGSPLSDLTEPVYGFLRDHFLSFQLPVFRYTALFLLMLLLLLLLELRERRFWCRNLCPLGALHGLLASRAPLGLSVDRTGCTACGRCPSVCRMGAIEGERERTIRKRDCVLCYDCVGVCEDRVIGHRAALLDSLESGPVLPLSRRAFLGSLGAGVLLPLAAGRPARPDALPATVIRPPGAGPEDLFTGLCLRCGECMRVCLTNGLQPTLFEAGFDAMWTPRLVSRVGYCEYSCTLCGQVCPTGAITHLDKVTKRKVRIGTAVIDRNTCIPFVRPEQCLVCEEHCPTPEKAIVFDDVTVQGPEGPLVMKRPRVVDHLCIGCGICENKCPLESASAIIIVRDGEDRAREGTATQLPLSGY
ncbi:MAG: 4Fe-4S binding protein [bacterium]|nr:MAG: 4Fe-4S binding protein [bacterium]